MHAASVNIAHWEVVEFIAWLRRVHATSVRFVDLHVLEFNSVLYSCILLLFSDRQIYTPGLQLFFEIYLYRTVGHVFPLFVLKWFSCFKGICVCWSYKLLSANFSNSIVSLKLQNVGSSTSVFILLSVGLASFNEIRWRSVSSQSVGTISSR